MEEKVLAKATREAEALASAQAMLEVKKKHEQEKAERRKTEAAASETTPASPLSDGATHGLATLKAAVAVERVGKALSKAQKKRAQKKRAALRKLEESKGGGQELGETST